MDAQVIFYNNYNAWIKKKLIVCMDLISLNRMLKEQKMFIVWDESYSSQYATETKPLRKFHKDEIWSMRKRIKELSDKWLLHKEDLHISVKAREKLQSLHHKNNTNALNV